MEEPQPLPQIIPPCRGGRTTQANSPEFEFWMVQNPTFPQPNLLSADELFSDGFLLPLHLIRLSDDHPHPKEQIQVPAPDQTSDLHPDSTLELPESSAPARKFSNSKHWKQIFKKSNKKLPESATAGGGEQSKDARIKQNKREKKSGGAGNMVSAAELNINLWPFSRSRSAGNDAARPRTAAPRKSSSAPCSRSNSGGESKARKWSNSPNRAAGVHLGRSSPVWQVRRVGVAAVKSSSKKDATDGRRKIPVTGALSLNVPTCIGYRQQMSWRNDENGLLSAAAADGGGGGKGSLSGEGVRRGSLFNIRHFFTKKVY